MANQTLAEIRYSTDIKNKDETIDRKIATIEAQTASVMQDMVTLYNTVEDAESKQLVVDKRNTFRANLNTLTTV